MQKKKGISLIVLVITIIVMIVLAGAIILSLNNAGIIGKANQAVSSTDEATVKELAQMAWAEAYADGVRKVETEGNKKGFQDRVTEALKANKIDTTKYLLNVTTKGVTAKLLAESWVQEGLTVKRGNDILNIGQTVNYNEEVEEYTGGWKVLGADEDGNLLIMSATDVNTVTLGSTTLTEAQKDWLNGGVSKLNNECEAYGKGKGAISVRCITVEDVNKVTGYNVETEVFGENTLYQYGNEVTYYYNASIKPSHTSVVTGETLVALETAHTNGFFWYDKTGFNSATPEALNAQVNNGKKLAKTTSNAYFYYGTTLSAFSSGDQKGLDTNTDVYKMLFGTSDNYSEYWLANTYIYTDPRYIGYGLRAITGGIVSGYALWRSTGIANAPEKGVRAVVTLESNVPMASLVQ